MGVLSKVLTGTLRYSKILKFTKQKIFGQSLVKMAIPKSFYTISRFGSLIFGIRAAVSVLALGPPVSGSLVLASAEHGLEGQQLPTDSSKCFPRPTNGQYQSQSSLDKLHFWYEGGWSCIDPVTPSISFFGLGTC